MAQHYGKGQGKTWSMEKGRWNGQSTDRSRYTWSDTETRAGFDKSRGKGIMQGKWDTTVKKGAEKGIEKGVEKGMEKERKIRTKLFITKCYSQGIDVETTALLTEMPVEEVQVMFDILKNGGAL